MSDAIHCNQYVLAALKESRAILAGEIAQLDSQVKAKRESLASIDVVIRLYAPEFDPSTLPGRRPRHESAYPLHNLNRMILGVLRRRGELMAVHEVADAIAAEMNYGEDAMRSVQERVRYALKSMAKGEKASVRKEGWRETARWGLAAGVSSATSDEI